MVGHPSFHNHNNHDDESKDYTIVDFHLPMDMKPHVLMPGSPNTSTSTTVETCIIDAGGSPHGAHFGLSMKDKIMNRLSGPSGGNKVNEVVVDQALHEMNDLCSKFESALHPVHLSFKYLSCSYTKSTTTHVKTTLHNVDGTLCSGHLTAVMGPSGSGKSTLLDILAMRKTVGNLSGLIYVNGMARGDLKASKKSGAPIISPNAYRQLVSYIPQEDLFLPTLTVLETLKFHMSMRLGPCAHHADEAEREKRCSLLLLEMGIYDKQHSLVGGPLAGGLSLRGLSGGEKRRLSIACGVVTQPSLIFIDEPTSGLDALSAVMVMDILKRQANHGVSVICSLHQPRAAIWRMIDKVMVLSEGRMVYSGEPSEAESWFSKTLGFHRTPDSSVADWILDLVNVSFDEKSKSLLSMGKTMRTVHDLDEAATTYKNNATPTLLSVRELIMEESVQQEWLSAPCDKPSAGSVSRFGYEYSILLKRTLKNYARNPGNAFARVGMILLVAVLQGLAFYKLSPQDTYNRLGALFFSCMALALAPYASMSLFIYDRQFYVKDLASNLYGVNAYYWGSLTVEFILSSIMGLLYSSVTFYMIGLNGSFGVYLAICVMTILIASQLAQLMALISSTQDIAMACGCGYTAISLLVSGFLVSYKSLGGTLSWAQWLAYPKYSLASLAINEFRDSGSLAWPSISDSLHVNNPLVSEVIYNIGALALVSIIASTSSILCLRYLHREKR